MEPLYCSFDGYVLADKLYKTDYIKLNSSWVFKTLEYELKFVKGNRIMRFIYSREDIFISLYEKTKDNFVHRNHNFVAQNYTYNSLLGEFKLKFLQGVKPIIDHLELCKDPNHDLLVAYLQNLNCIITILFERITDITAIEQNAIILNEYNFFSIAILKLAKCRLSHYSVKLSYRSIFPLYG